MKQQTLMLGTAKVDITPPLGAEMGGFVARQGTVSGVHDRLTAYVLVFCDGDEKLALVMTDLIGVDAALISEVRQAAAKLTEIPGERIIIGAIHTHAGPAVLRGGFLGKPDESYLSFLVQSLAGAIYQADKQQEPVKAFHGRSECPLVGKNRRQLGGPTDPEVSVLCFKGEMGTKAILVNYACHPVVLGPDNLLVSADYPYYLRETLSSLYPGALVVFANGAAGNINTGHQARASINGTSGNKRTFAEAQRLGRILAGEVMKAVETASEALAPFLKVDSRMITLSVEKIPSPEEYAKMKLDWDKKYQELKKTGGSYGETQEALLMAEWAEAMKTRSERHGLKTEIPLELTVFSIGDCEFYTLPGEFFFEFGLMLKQARKGKSLFILGYTNGCIGYVAPEPAYDEGGYELTDSYRYYGLPTGLQRGSGEKVVQSLLALRRL